MQDTHKKVFLQIFAAVLPPHKSPSQAPYVQIPYPNRPFGGVNRPNLDCEFFVDFTQFFYIFSTHRPSSGKNEWFGGGVFIVSSLRLCTIIPANKKGLPRRTTLIRILVLLDISFSNNSRIASIPTTPSKQNLPKRATPKHPKFADSTNYPSVHYFWGNFVFRLAGNSGAIVKSREAKFPKKSNAKTSKIRR